MIKMRKILFIGDNLDSFKLMTDSTYLLMLGAKKLNYQIFYCHASDIYSLDNQVYADLTQLNILPSLDGDFYNVNKWYEKLDLYTQVSLTEFKAVMVRTDPPFNMEYYYLTQMLSLAEKSGVRVINNSASLRNFNEKLAILNFPKLITPTLVSKSKQAINKFIDKHGECVAKPIDLMGGRGVFKIAKKEVNRSAIIETLTDFYSQTIMVQKFIPEVVLGDKRIWIINGEVIDYCLYRIPQNGEIRGNIASGGRGEVHKLTESDYKLANEVAPWLREQGIIFAGLDVIGNYLTEINITSPTGTHQIYQHARINIPLMILQDIEK